MPEAWEEEWSLPTEEIKGWIAETSGLPAPRLQFLGEGWDNQVFLEETQSQVYRFPKREVGLKRLHLEARILPILGELPLNIPKPTLHTLATCPVAFTSYPLLEGNTACSQRLPLQQRAELAPILGRFLKSLHQFPLEPLETHGLEQDSNHVMTPEKRQNITFHMFKQVEKWFPGIPLAKLHATWEESVALGFSPTVNIPTQLVHGDFYARHFLLDAQYHLSAIIDWGDMFLGDPAADLEVIHSFLSPQHHALFESTYGPISQDMWHRARFRGLYHSVLMGYYAHQNNDSDLIYEMRFALEQMLGL